VSLQGAAWFIGDSTVTAVTAEAITLRTEGGATQRAYRDRQRDELTRPHCAPMEMTRARHERLLSHAKD
jgi:hypothetical protein